MKIKTMLTAEYDGEIRTMGLTDWSVLTGISAAVISSRITKGWTPDKAVSEPVTRVTKQVTYEGKTQSIAEWSRELNIPSYVLQRRLQQGWTSERALMTPVRSIRKNVHAKYLEYNGIKLSISDWERKCGFPRGIIQQRLSLGWSVEDAITKPIQGSAKKDKAAFIPTITTMLTCHGVSKSIREWSSEKGIAYNTLVSRLKSGWSPEQAVMQPVRKKRQH